MQMIFRSASKIIALRMFSFWLHPDFIYRRTKYFVQEMKAKSISAYTYVDNVITNIRETTDKNRAADEKPSTFMRALMDEKHNLTHSEIVDEIRSLLIAVSMNLYDFIFFNLDFSGTRYISLDIVISTASPRHA